MTKTSYIADLHIHSRYSRATSKASNLQGLAAWAAIKGIDVVGTGDFTHPGWFAHLTEHLEEAEPGLFKLREQLFLEELAPILPPGVQPDTSGIRFVLSSEISSIYKRDDKVRKVHNILFAPDFESVRRINTTLAGIGNLESDGRPILGLDSRNLLEIMLAQAPQGFLVPAHIWTPWFSLFGSKSGFDAIEECFGDLSDEIFALETGLSSDPDMNRCISALDRFSLISNSDCHSPSKLGREANIFTTDLDFFSMQQALRQPVDADGNQRFAGTIEFYPEEGKYHCDGHRKCGVCLEPAQTKQQKGICPQCGKPLTIGVLYRVMELADREAPVYPQGSPIVHSLIPLHEMLGELFNTGPATKKVATIYGKLINTFGSEFNLLLNASLSDIKSVSPMLAKAVKRVREKKVIRMPGFDGEFGVIRVFTEEERQGLGGQLNLFGLTPAKPRNAKKRKLHNFKASRPAKKAKEKQSLNQQQQDAVDSRKDRIIVKAGPGTGKTHTLVQRAFRLLENKKNRMTVITFTNKAAEEVRQRLEGKTGADSRVRVNTFHAYCLGWLHRKNPKQYLVGPELQTSIVRKLYPDLVTRERSELQREIGLFLSGLSSQPENYPASFQPFFSYLRDRNLLDLDEVVLACAKMIADDGNFAAQVRAETGHLLIDEFQDLNAGQYELVRLLSQGCPVFGIGDPDQAIYGFRGSSPGWFHRFIEKQKAELHTLTINYRSSASILQAAGDVIAANHPSDDNPITAGAGAQTGRIYNHLAADSGGEARFIGDQIQLLVGGTSHREIDRLTDLSNYNMGLSDIAVLYRTSKQAEAIAQVLAERGIPFQVVDVKPFFQTGDARIIYSWVLLASDMIDKAELLYLLGREEGIGAKTLAEADDIVTVDSRSPFTDLLADIDRLPALLQQKLREFANVIDSMQRGVNSDSVVAAIDTLLERYSINREQVDIIRIRQMAESASTLAAFGEHLRRHQDQVIYDHRAEAVFLGTLHASKGLEFGAVFLAGCEEGLLPLAPREPLEPEREQEHLQEERRLFFVGMTRAARVLYLLHAKKRTSYGEELLPDPSRFLSDIPRELVQLPPMAAKKKKKKKTARQMSLF